MRKIQLPTKFIYPGSTLQHLGLKGEKFIAQNESEETYLLNFLKKNNNNNNTKT